jgi:hypothetical protein
MPHFVRSGWIIEAPDAGRSLSQIGPSWGPGCAISFLRFKEQILDMDDSSIRLFQLQPVTFFYKPQYDDGSHLQQYGVIAEEWPRSIPTCRLRQRRSTLDCEVHYLAPMLLNELQKQHRVIAAQQAQIKEMQNRLSRLEALIDRKRLLSVPRTELVVQKDPNCPHSPSEATTLFSTRS